MANPLHLHVPKQPVALALSNVLWTPFRLMDIAAINPVFLGSQSS